MKNIKLFEDFINEFDDVKEVYADEINPAAAKALLKLAIKQKEDKFQGSYTVDKGKKSNVSRVALHRGLEVLNS